MSSTPTEPEIDYDRIYELILRETSSKTGKDFFRAITRNLAQSLDTWGCWVTEYFPDDRRMLALAFYANGAFLKHYEYDLEGSPCAPVIDEKRIYHIGDKLQKVFPEHDLMKSMGAMSYVGSPLLGNDGSAIGLFGMMDTKPLFNRVKLSLFELFSERAGAELKRMIMERDIHEREAQLSTLHNNAMDSIILLDSRLLVEQANPSAHRAFGFEDGELIGEPILERFNAPCNEALASIAKALLTKGDASSLWIPDKLRAVRKYGERFLAEASLSLIYIEDEPHYTLILRDANDAIESEKRIGELIRESEVLRESAPERSSQEQSILGECQAVAHLKDEIARVAKTDSSVLVQGETGVGKELVARSIHAQSQRSGKPLIIVNCAALPENLVESELFGHEKGAFTGANASREGRFAQADGGTLFLDEIGELPLNAQAKLLRVLQEGEYESLGSSKTRKTDVRVIAATHRDLQTMADDQSFRSDLFFRLNVYPLAVPPLRERGDDIAILSRAIMEKLSKRMGRRIPELDDNAITLLKRHNWPGNVRELQNTLERALIVSSGQSLDFSDLITANEEAEYTLEELHSEDGRDILTIEQFRELEKRNIELALKASSGRVSGGSGAAALLGMKPTTLSSRIKALGIVLA